MHQIRKLLSNHLVNSIGWKTKQKIVVFESDDWGSIRIPNNKAYESLLRDGIPVDKSPYCKYDNLCSSEDVQKLFETLQKHKDVYGNHPIITANVVVANPDFEKIKKSGYNDYFYETTDKTLERFFPNESPMALWKEGLNQKIFIPQCHGREHVNVPFWLETLKNKDRVFTKAFELGCWGISSDVYNKYPKSIQASFDYNSTTELAFMKESISDGLRIFKQLFGYESKSFIPGNYIWAPQLNQTLLENGAAFMQGMKYQLLPKPIAGTKRKMLRRHNGQMLGGLLQTVRNTQFEPSLRPNSQRQNEVKDCLEQIRTSFLWKKPAIVSVHRINFCSALHAENRDINLSLFDQLLKEITKRWPDVTFMDSVSLGNIIK